MRILCFGDSNTFGYDPRGFFGDRYGTEDRWLDLLAKQTGHECINAGANGREILRNPYALRLLTEHAPLDIFLVMLGTNDLLQGTSAKEAATRMEAFLNPLLPHCTHLRWIHYSTGNNRLQLEKHSTNRSRTVLSLSIFFLL